MSREIRRVGIWIRVSTGKQFEGDSPETHRVRARAYAESRGWEVIEEYVPTGGVSGGVSFDHPDMQRMLADLASGKIEGLIFSKLARLVRNTGDAIELAEIFEEAEGAMVNLSQNLDTSTPFGRMVYRQVASFDEWERDEATDRIRSAIPIRAKMGRNTGGAAPYGWRWGANKQLEIHPDEAPVLRLIFELFLEHRRCKTVERILFERGYRNRAGRPFSNVMIDYMLKDPAAKGLRKVNRIQTEAPKGRKRRRFNAKGRLSVRKVTKPESEWVWVNVPPIIDESIWNACNEIRVNQMARRHKIARNAFSGILRCGHCDKPMYCDPNHKHRNRRYRCKGCRANLLADALDQKVGEQLRAFFSNPDALGLQSEQIQHSFNTERELLTQRSREKARLTQQINQISADYLSGELQARRYEVLVSKLEADLASAESEIARLEGVIAALEVGQVESAQSIHQARELLVSWEIFSATEKREALGYLVDSIIYLDGEIKIDVAYDPVKLPTAEVGKGKTLVRFP